MFESSILFGTTLQPVGLVSFKNKCFQVLKTDCSVFQIVHVLCRNIGK